MVSICVEGAEKKAFFITSVFFSFYTEVGKWNEAQETQAPISHSGGTLWNVPTSWCFGLDTLSGR